VFANILVNDIEADRHFLIGNNLQGLQGFIWEAWEEFAQTVSLWSGDSGDMSDQAIKRLDELARRFRVPTNETHLRGAMETMVQAAGQAQQKRLTEETTKEILGACWDPAHVARCLGGAGWDSEIVKSVTDQLSRLVKNWHAYSELAAVARHAGAAGPSGMDWQSIDQRLRETLRTWFAQKLVVIDNYHATGEQIIQRIVDETPLGFRNRIMGLQNIKGTGMDFVQRWQDWDTCHRACDALASRNLQAAEEGLRTLASQQHFGLLCREQVRKAVQTAQHSPLLQRDQFQAELEFILGKLETSGPDTVQQQSANSPVGGLIGWIRRRIEDFADVNDALRRRTSADRIYKDLIAERISRHTAAQQLRALEKRQKGGWLNLPGLNLPSNLTRPSHSIARQETIDETVVEHKSAAVTRKSRRPVDAVT
jgi:hypothetical protein